VKVRIECILSPMQKIINTSNDFRKTRFLIHDAARKRLSGMYFKIISGVETSVLKLRLIEGFLSIRLEQNISECDEFIDTPLLHLGFALLDPDKITCTILYWFFEEKLDSGRWNSVFTSETAIRLVVQPIHTLAANSEMKKIRGSGSLLSISKHNPVFKTCVVRSDYSFLLNTHLTNPARSLFHHSFGYDSHRKTSAGTFLSWLKRQLCVQCLNNPV